MRLVHRFAALVTAVFTPLAIASNYDGALDTTFGAGGLADYASSGGLLAPNALVRQPDGKFIVVGETAVDCNPACANSADFAMRLLPDGSPDPTWPIRTYAVPSSGAYAAAQMDSGDLLIAGRSEDGFGTITRVSDDLWWTLASPVAGEYDAVAALPGAGVIAVGSMVSPAGDRDFFIAHYGASDVLLASATVSFNAGGDNDDWVYAVAVAGNRIYVIGTVDLEPNADGTPNVDCGLAVLTLDPLALDPSWDANSPSPGRTRFGFDANFDASSADICRAIAVQRDGRVVVGGELYQYFDGTSASLWGLARFLPSGHADPDFGAGTPSQTVGFYDALGAGQYNEIGTLAIQQDGGIVFAGYATILDEGSAPADFGVGRVDSAGHTDPSFGTTRPGVSTIGYLFDEGQGGLGSTQYATAMVLDAGRPVVVGVNYRYPDSDGLIDTMLVRLESDAIFADGFDAAGTR